MTDKLKQAMQQNVNKSERTRMLFIMAITTILGMLILPHDATVATIATKYIFPAAAAGICFGIGIMAAIVLWKDAKKVEQLEAASAKAGE